MVTFGTDYVFDGTSTRPYREEDPANPLSVYGKTKWAAEQALREEGGDHLLVRTQWLFGPAGKTSSARSSRRRVGRKRFASRRTRSGARRFRGTWPAPYATCSARARGDGPLRQRRETSWFGLARYVLQHCGLPTGSLFAAATRDLPYPAPRPAYGVLSKEKYRAITGVSRGRGRKRWGSTLK